jgi:uncharacterized protein (TIRG00374 family)
MVWIKRIFTLVLLIILLYLFWPLAKELGNLNHVFREARWGWLLAAVAIEFVSYAFLTSLNLALLEPFPGKISFWRMMAVLPAIAFIEVTVPSAGASGVVLRARLLGKSGYSPETSTFTVAMETIFIGVLMTAVALLGLWHLTRTGEIHRFQIILLVMLSVMLLVAGGLAIWYGRDRQQVKRLALRLNAFTNRWLAKYHRPANAEEAVLQRIEAFYNGLSRLRTQPTWPYLLTSFGRVSLDVVCLGVCFIAFNFVISPGTLLTGYGLMLLVSGLAVLPGGLGMADLSLTVIYARLGAPGAVAVAAALAYRLITWWLVRFAGFISWQVLEARVAKKPASR